MVWAFFCSIYTFVILLVEFDPFTIPSFYAQIWYIIITMTTVGYGDYFTKNAFGDWVSIIAVFVGQLLVAVYILILFNNL